MIRIFMVRNSEGNVSSEKNILGLKFFGARSVLGNELFIWEDGGCPQASLLTEQETDILKGQLNCPRLSRKELSV